MGASRAKGGQRLPPERGAKPPSESEPGVEPRRALKKDDASVEHAERKKLAAEQRKREQAEKKAQSKISDLEARIADREQAMKEIETAMSAPGFYENHDQAQPLIDRHQALMWELGELMHQWEELSKAGS
jgi:predicted  nucleic acid-binding Zn-ribbon protein